MTNDFKTTCVEGKPHLVGEDTNEETECIICYQKVKQTSEYSGYYFTPEDFINWDIVYNGVKED